MTKRQLLNIQNNNNLTGRYPMFLGDTLGLLDEAHVTYPEIESLRDQLIAKNWRWDEIDLTKDAAAIQNPSLAPEVDILVKNLSFQSVGDSLASCSIYDMLAPFCTNTELKTTLQFWSYNESVHALAYSFINKTVFTDPNQLIEDTKQAEEVLKRANVVQGVFSDLFYSGCKYTLGELEDKHEIAKKLCVAIGTLLGLEAISFTASFASTFSLARTTGEFQGIASILQLILDEERLHAKIDLNMLSALKSDFPEAYAEALPDIEKALNKTVQLEFEWSDWLFSEGRRMLGLNSGLLKRYIAYLATPIFKHLELNAEFDFVEEDVLPWMKDYSELDVIQVAPQELQTNNYLGNTIVKDYSEDEEFDF